VTTITLSIQQKQLAEEKITRMGLTDRIEVKLIDYREMKGQFDKIVSIEMLEAVGHEFLPTYFETCWRLMKPGGRMVFQVITTPNRNYETYRFFSFLVSNLIVSFLFLLLVQIILSPLLSSCCDVYLQKRM